MILECLCDGSYCFGSIVGAPVFRKPSYESDIVSRTSVRLTKYISRSVSKV